MKASDLFVQALENEGVKYIFGVPGEENLDFVESLRNSSIKLIVTRHEQPAGFMAATYGRLTGRMGVCLSTLGPGATNLMTAASYAQLGAMPMMMITGQKPIHKSKQGQFQIIDTVNMMKPVTKYTCQIGHGDRIPAIVREATRQAEFERPGAVHLELPEDVAAEETTAPLYRSGKPRRPRGNVKSIRSTVQMIEKAKHPLLLIGAGSNRKRVSEMLHRFVKKTGIYFFNTQMGKGVLPGDHAQSLGTAALSSGDYVHCAVEKADLIINVGHDVVEKPPFFMEKNGTPVIDVNFFPATVDQVYFPQLELIGDIADSFYKITNKIVRQEHWDNSYFAKVKAVAETKISEKSDAPNFPMLPQRIVADVQAVMGNEDIIALDNGMYKLWFARNYRAHCTNTVLLDNALATMGAGLPSAMMAKMIFPKKKVMAICGDGGFMMNSQEVETALRLKLDLVIVILNDNGYGMIKWKQDHMNFPSFGLDFGNPDFVKYAESYGAKGHRVEKTEDFVPMLNAAFESGGVHLIEVPIDYSENIKVFTDELKDKACVA
jgi:acetolactate synthase-1/2/3 large subunit